MKRQDKEMADSVLPRTGGEEGTIGMRRCALAERENYVWVIYIYIYIYKYICMYLDISILCTSSTRTMTRRRECNGFH